MTIATRLLKWYDQHGRHDLPWQTGEAYRVWLSEIMLQQTQVATVIPYFQRFIARFPDIRTLATSPVSDVLTLWSGLGYYARARNLHKTAQIILQHFGGHFPQDVQTLLTLPGIGQSTAGAICAQAYALHAPILDGNVKRVLTRLYAISGWPGEKKTEQQLWTLAESNTPRKRIADYTQAIMDLGATVCTRSRPLCSSCPLQKQCIAYQTDRVSEFPEKKTKAKLPERYTQWLILMTASKQIYLEHFAEKLWGGLWVFPDCAIAANPDKHLRKYYASQFKCKENLPPFSHTFTHFRLHIQPIYYLVSKQKMLKTRLAASQWIESKQIPTLPLPTPVKKLLLTLSK